MLNEVKHTALGVGASVSNLVGETLRYAQSDNY